jgi:NitT/TauT family transport system substrate-binding protein
MTDARWKKMFDFMVSNKMLPASFDYKKAYDLQFIKGLDIMPAGE